MITFTVNPSRPTQVQSPVLPHVPSKRSRRRAKRKRQNEQTETVSPPVLPSPPVKPKDPVIAPKSKLNLGIPSRDAEIVARLKARGIKLWSEDPECY